MNRQKVKQWLEDYITAWRTSGTDSLSEIFTEDISYTLSPWRSPLHGLDEVKRFWEKARDSAEEEFEIRTEIVAVDHNIAVVRLEVEYANDVPSQWRDLWILTFNTEGLCYTFEEWPFSPQQSDGQTLN